MIKTEFYWHNSLEDDKRAGKLLCKANVELVPSPGDLIHLSELLKGDLNPVETTYSQLLDWVAIQGSLYAIERALTYDIDGNATYTVYLGHRGI